MLEHETISIRLRSQELCIQYTILAQMALRTFRFPFTDDEGVRGFHYHAIYGMRRTIFLVAIQRSKYRKLV